MQSYKDWCAERAVAGDAAAIAQLRGWAYQDSRRRSAAQRDEQEALKKATIAGNGADAPISPQRNEAARIEWSVDRRSGDVTYLIDGVGALRDTGRLVAVLQPQDSKSIEAGLKLAAQKFGPELTLSGPAEFQRRVVEIAVEKGLGVRFADPAADAYRAQLEQARQATYRKEKQSGNQSSNHESQSRDGWRGSGQEKVADVLSVGGEPLRPVPISDVAREAVTNSDQSQSVLQRSQSSGVGRGR